MKRLSPLGLLTIWVGTTAMAGAIDIGTPLISGDVSTFGNRQETGPTDISPDQLQTLARWLEEHRSGWDGMVTPATSEPVELRVNLKHSGGSTTTISVIARASGGHYLRLTGPGTWAYRSFGGILKSWAATRPLSDQDLAWLRNIASARS